MAQPRRLARTHLLQRLRDGDHEGDRARTRHPLALPHRRDHHRAADRRERGPTRRTRDEAGLHRLLGRPPLRAALRRRPPRVEFHLQAAARRRLSAGVLGRGRGRRRTAPRLRGRGHDHVLPRRRDGREDLGVRRRDRLHHLPVHRGAQRGRVLARGLRGPRLLRHGRERHRWQGRLLCGRRAHRCDALLLRPRFWVVLPTLPRGRRAPLRRLPHRGAARTSSGLLCDAPGLRLSTRSEHLRQRLVVGDDRREAQAALHRVEQLRHRPRPGLRPAHADHAALRRGDLRPTYGHRRARLALAPARGRSRRPLLRGRAEPVHDRIRTAPTTCSTATA